MAEVAEEEKNDVFWVYRKTNPKWKVPVILTRNARKTTFITVTFERCENRIILSNWYFGGKSFPFPGQVERRRGSRKFSKLPKILAESRLNDSKKGDRYTKVSKRDEFGGRRNVSLS
ncbi:MAG: hypothetical protein V8R51_07385 [Clostridia bacterium]